VSAIPAQFLKVYEAISKLFGVHHSIERKINHKWKSFKTAVNLLRSGHHNRFTPRSDHAILRETAKNAQAPFQTLQASLSMLNVKVHDSTIRKKLNKYGLFGKDCTSKEEVSFL